jgi:hypothetical protein
MYNPINIKEYDIYDIFHNDENQIIIIMPMEKEKMNIKYEEKRFIINSCPHRHTYVYVLECEVEYKRNIELTINERSIKTEVNKYPNFKEEIIMSTIVLDEDAYIKQWIKYHKNIGISRFIIYDNKEEGSNLEKILEEYINEGVVILIRWAYAYRLEKSGISGQTTQQNHSIWAFKKSKYIGLFDVDEYINIQNGEKNINNLFNNLIREKKINIKRFGSFRLLNKSFYNPNNLATDGYNFLKIYNCDEILLVGREKNFVIPKNVYTFSVHMITSGKKMYTVQQDKIFFNHYMFLNKTDRGKNETKYIDDSINKHINF